MKLSILKWLSSVIALPLFITTLAISTSASAEQIDRSRAKIKDYIPSVTDLNLKIPVEASISTDDYHPINEKETSRSNPNRHQPRIATVNSSISVQRQEVSKSKSSSRLKNRSATKINYAISIESEPAQQVKTLSKSKNLVATKVEPNIAVVSKDHRKSKSNSRQKLAAISSPPMSGTYLQLVRDPARGTNDLGNPIYKLEAYIDGELERTFNAVSGTAYTQSVDRNLGNNHAPLPDGLYNVSEQIVPGAVAEVGKTFIGIYPQFQTNRNDLGIHLDPSFNKRNGRDGTSGCIGLTNPEDRDAINEFVSKYHPRNLVVKIISAQERE